MYYVLCNNVINLIVYIVFILSLLGRIMRGYPVLCEDLAIFCLLTLRFSHVISYKNQNPKAAHVSTAPL